MSGIGGIFGSIFGYEKKEELLPAKVPSVFLDIPSEVKAGSLTRLRVDLTGGRYDGACKLNWQILRPSIGRITSDNFYEAPDGIGEDEKVKIGVTVQCSGHGFRALAGTTDFELHTKTLTIKAVSAQEGQTPSEDEPEISEGVVNIPSVWERGRPQVSVPHPSITVEVSNPEGKTEVKVFADEDVQVIWERSTGGYYFCGLVKLPDRFHRADRPESRLMLVNRKNEWGIRAWGDESILDSSLLINDQRIFFDSKFKGTKKHRRSYFAPMDKGMVEYQLQFISYED